MDVEVLMKSAEESELGLIDQRFDLKPSSASKEFYAL